MELLIICKLINITGGQRLKFYIYVKREIVKCANISFQLYFTIITGLC